MARPKQPRRQPDRPFPECLQAVLGGDAATERLDRIVSGFGQLTRYREFVRRLDEAEQKRGGECAGLRERLVDEASEFELQTRLISGDALEQLNDLRDADALGPLVLAGAEDLGRWDGDPAMYLEDSRAAIQRAVPTLPEAAIDEALAVARDRTMRVRRDGDLVAVSMKGINGEVGEERFTPGPVAGSAGRVSVADFFGSAGRAVSPARPYLPQMVDCHREPPLKFAHPLLPRDLYASMVGGLATMKESAYRHARRVDEVGHGGLQLRDPVTAIVVGAIVVGAILVGAGIVVLATGGDTSLGITLIGFGAILIGGAICVAVGACTFVLVLFLSVAV